MIIWYDHGDGFQPNFGDLPVSAHASLSPRAHSSHLWIYVCDCLWILNKMIEKKNCWEQNSPLVEVPLSLLLPHFFHWKQVVSFSITFGQILLLQKNCIKKSYLRVSISMFISGLWTLVGIWRTGSDTFIDDARFSIRRCLRWLWINQNKSFIIVFANCVWYFHHDKSFFGTWSPSLRRRTSPQCWAP